MQRLYTVINITEIGENTVTDDATGNIICLPLEANETLVDERSKRTLLKPALLVEVYASGILSYTRLWEHKGRKASSTKNYAFPRPDFCLVYREHDSGEASHLRTALLWVMSGVTQDTSSTSGQGLGYTFVNGRFI